MSTMAKDYLTKVTKPKPPLTAYNLYFQVERKRILEGTDSLCLPISSEDMRRASLEHKAKTGKRLHRKTHGKIGFKELARVVASRWKALDSGTKEMLEDHARMEKQVHTVLLEEWKKTDRYKQEAEEIERDDKEFQKVLSSQVKNPADMMEEAAQTAVFSFGRVECLCQMSEFEIFQSMWKDLEPIGSMVFRNEVHRCDVGTNCKNSGHPIGTQRNAQTNFQFSSVGAYLLEPTPFVETSTAAAKYPQDVCGSMTFTGFGSLSNHASHINRSNRIEEKSNQCSSDSFSIDLEGARSRFDDTNQWDELCYLASLVEPL